MALQQQLVEDVFRDRARRRDPRNPNAGTVDRRPNNNNTGSTNTTGTGTQNNNKNFVPLPSLIETKKDLLRRNDGCFKCQQFFVRHKTASCPNGFPTGAGYRTLTEAMAEMAKNRGINVVISAEVESGGGGSAVASTTTIAAVIPHISMVLGDDSKSEENKYIAPLYTPHIFWDCLLDGPNIASPVKIRALIDSGSHTVVIDRNLVEKLVLRRCRLPKPLEVNLAMGGKENKLTLKEWVKIMPSAIDMSWRSRSTRTIIAHNLICPMILGCPFLKVNQIVVNHEIPLCVSKRDNFDLLQHPTYKTTNTTQAKVTESVKNETSDTDTTARVENKGAMLDELLQRTQTTKKELDKQTDKRRL